MIRKNPQVVGSPGRRRPASRLELHRIAQGLTQEGLAAAAGCSVDTISNAERGLHRPHRATRVAIAGGLGIDHDDLFSDDARPGDRTSDQSNA